MYMEIIFIAEMTIQTQKMNESHRRPPKFWTKTVMTA